MGKNFPKLRKLSEVPELYGELIKLIQVNLGYSPEFNVDQDFAPLFQHDNWSNCYLMIDENKPIAHVGFKKIKIDHFEIGMIGAVVVDKNHRGKGYFKELMSEVISDYQSEICFFLLWSDQLDLYAQFGFKLCGHQYQLNKNDLIENKFIKTKYSLCSEKQKQEIQDLYKSSWQKRFLSVNRDSKDWEIIMKMNSMDLFIHENNNQISSYFFMNKGQDLQNIIFEFGTKEPESDFYQLLQSYGNLWTGESVSEETHFQFMLSLGDMVKFQSFVHYYSENKILIKNINRMKNEIYFEFENQNYGLDIDEFLHGFFGPGSFEEVNIPRLFISGADSV